MSIDYDALREAAEASVTSASATYYAMASPDVLLALLDELAVLRDVALREPGRLLSRAQDAEAALRRVEEVVHDLANPDPALITPVERAHRRTVARELRAALEGSDDDRGKR